MQPDRLPLDETLNSLPTEWPVDPLPGIQVLFKQAGSKLVILDDDPTGSQTIFGIPVLTEWPVEALLAELENNLAAFFILTNSRSLATVQAEQIGAEIGRNLAKAVKQSGRAIAVVSRGDSTLRGHFPEEVSSLASGLQTDFDAWLLIPALYSAGRYTIGDIHYVADGKWLTPVGSSVYAQDGTFGYCASNLREWVIEKTRGGFPEEKVLSISLEDIRSGGPEAVFRRLMVAPHGSVVVVNAASQRDFQVIVHGVMSAEAQGKRYLYRTTASFIPERIGLPPYPLIEPEQLYLTSGNGGLILVGSYVPKTSEQMDYLLHHEPVKAIEVDVARLMDPEQRNEAIEEAALKADQGISQGQDTVVYTSRQLVLSDDPERNLLIGQQISTGMIEILDRIRIRPRYILAKGGITSHDVATKGLGVRRAIVEGQILPGISIWRLGPETRYEGLIYVVFPGNVGGAETLANVVNRLSGQEKSQRSQG